MFICASLTDAIDRRASFSRHFPSKSQFEFVDSIDGRNWSSHYADTYCTSSFVELRARQSKQNKTWANPAAVACAMTHRDKLLKEAVHRDAILCEDDALIDQKMIQLWQQQNIRDIFRNIGDVTLLFYLSRSTIRVSKIPLARVGPYCIYRVTDGEVGSAVSYYASSVAADRIRSLQTPISATADQWQAFKARGAISNINIVFPSPVRLAAFESHIGYGGRLKGNSITVRALRVANRSLRRWRGKFGADVQFE